MNVKTKPSPAPRKRLPPEERRATVIEVARRHFAERGYYGTPTAAIADDAGISHAYLFRLFPTKQDLFAASTAACIAKTRAAFERGAAEPQPGETKLGAMGRSYGELLAEDPSVLLGQLHANAAAAREPKIREAMRDGWAELYKAVSELSEAPPDDIRRFFASGMLLNVAAAVGFDEINEPWAQSLRAKDTEPKDTDKENPR